MAKVRVDVETLLAMHFEAKSAAMLDCWANMAIEWARGASQEISRLRMALILIAEGPPNGNHAQELARDALALPKA
jgi:hypothetical protein